MIQITAGVISMILSSIVIFFSSALAGQMFIVGMGNLLFGSLFAAFHTKNY